MKTFSLSKLILLVLSFFLLYSCNTNNSDNKSEKINAKYVFYFIGDGMSNQHVDLTQAFLKDAEDEEIGYQRLAFDTLPGFGMISTFANNSLITGSAAAGTAMATGNKTNLKRISMDTKGEKDYESIAYKLKKKGRKIGIISTVSINHATPAVFYANQENRHNYYEIGKQLPESNFDFFGGGGFKKPEKNGNNLYDNASSKGYKVYQQHTDLMKLDNNKPVLLVNPVLGRDAEMPYAIDRKYEGGYTLSEITRAAIEKLYSDKGFFIMVESGKIDWASHKNDAATIIMEMLDFEKSVVEALNFYKKHPDETLIIVTSDHETGGLALNTNSPAKMKGLKSLGRQKMSLKRATELLNKKKITRSDFKEIFDISGTTNEWENSVLKRAEKPGVNPDKQIDYGSYHPALVSYLKIKNARAGIKFSAWEHTSAEVPVFAIGNGQELFNGKYDNTDLPEKIMEASTE